jgi:hypothetical protein
MKSLMLGLIFLGCAAEAVERPPVVPSPPQPQPVIVIIYNLSPHIEVTSSTSNDENGARVRFVERQGDVK